MKRRTDGLVSLLRMNGSLYRGITFREPYSFRHLMTKPRKDTLQDLLGMGEALVEKIKKIRMIGGALRNFGINPYFVKFVKKTSGRAF